MAEHDGERNRNTVFIDTSLDTHFVMVISDSDTVSDLKQKIIIEHRQIFPAIGDIKINSLKVKLRGKFYHLADSMPVLSAFVDTKKHRFILVDASLLEQCGGIQHFNNQKIENQLALPWVTDIGHEYSHVNGSPSMMHPKLVPFVNQKVPSVDDRFTSASENIQESNSEKKMNYKSKKRTRDVHNKSLEEDDLVSKHSKKKRKTQKVDGSVKASENGDKILEHKSKGKNVISDDLANKDLGDENYSVLDQAAIVVSSNVGLETHSRKDSEGCETVADVLMVVEKIIQQNMSVGKSLEKKDDELVQKTDIGIEIPSPLTRPADSDVDAPVVTSEVNLKESPEVKHNETEKEDKTVKLKRGKSERFAKKNKDELLVKDADIPPGGVSSLVPPVPLFDDKTVDEKNEVSEKTSMDDDPIVKKVEISEPTENHRIEENIEEREKTMKEVEDFVGSKKKKKGSRRSDSRNNESAVMRTESNEETRLTQFENKESVEKTNQESAEDIKDDQKREDENMDGTKKSKKKKKTKKSNHETVKENESVLPDADKKDNIQETNNLQEKDNLHEKDNLGTNEVTPLPHFENKESMENQNQENTHDYKDDSKKENGNMDGTKKIKKKTKSKKSAERNEDESTAKHANEKESGDKKDNLDEEILAVNEEKTNLDEGLVKKAKKNPKSRKRNEDESIMNHENAKESESLLPGADKNNNLVEEISAVHEAKTSFDEGLIKKPKKNPKVSLKDRLNPPSKRQSTEVEVEPEETTKNEVNNKDNDIPNEGSQDINFRNYFTPDKISSFDKDAKKPKKKSKEIQPVLETSSPQVSVQHQSKKEQNKKKIPEDSTDDVVKDPNVTSGKVDQVKTPKITRKIDALKNQSGSNSETFGRSLQNETIKKPLLTVGPGPTPKILKKPVPVMKSLLNSGGTIFGNSSDDGSSDDDNAGVSSGSSTRTPSRKSSSSSGESDASIYSKRIGKRKESGGGNKSINSLGSKARNASMADLLRSSTRFKKARQSAASSQHVEDTESQPVDFVPESQPLG